MARKTDLNDTVKVERYVFSLEVKNTYRNALFDAYSQYCRVNSIEWNRPELKTEIYPVKVPTEENIDKVISSASMKYAVIFHLSKHGLRPDEISKVTLRDIDFSMNRLSVRTSKLGLERTITLKKETIDLLRDYINRYRFSELHSKIFTPSKSIRIAWTHYRKKAYQKFKDTELLKIRLYDLRHWFGTTQYIKTRDIFHVKYLMGHRNIESTLHYMHIAKGLINYSEEYTVKVATNIEEFTTLLESGFEYVSDYDDKKILRKRR